MMKFFFQKEVSKSFAQLFRRITTPKNFAKFIRKHLSWIPILVKFESVTYKFTKKDTITDIYP